MKDEIFAMALRSLEIEARAIDALAWALPRDAFGKAVELLCNGKVITSGCGGSGIAAKKFAHSLCCIERDAYFLPPCEALHGGMGCIKGGDTVVLLSRGGKTAELLPIMQVAQDKGAHILTVTENLSSPLAKGATVVLPMTVPRETDKYNVMTTTSFIVAAALFDALFVAVMEVTGYRLEQFAPIHPGGAVGERLSKKQ